MKHCPKCSEDKKLSEFNKNKNKKDGYANLCRSCVKYYQNKYYKENKDKFVSKMMIRKKTLNKFIVDIKIKSGCKVCGENHIATLDFHHRNPEDKKLDITRAVANGWGIKRLQKEIDKCDVLCSNCHRKLHWKERQ